MEPIYIGIKGRVIALNRKSGQQLWETHLTGSQFVNVHREGDHIFATTKGEVFCLDVRSGKIKWENGMKGMGYGLVTIAGSPANEHAIAEQIHRMQAAAASGGAAGAS